MDDRESVDILLKQIQDINSIKIIQAESNKDISKLKEDINHAYAKIRGLNTTITINEGKIYNLERMIDGYKNWIKGAYAAVTLLLGVIIYLFIQTGALGRIFAGN